MRKESFILVFGTILSIVALIGLKVVHFYVHGRCECLSGKLFEYGIPLFGLISVVFITNRLIINLIKQRETYFDEKTMESEGKYRELFETITDGIVFSDIEGNIISCNKGFSDMLGYTMEEIKARKCSDITPPEWLEKDKKKLKEQIIKKGYSDIYEKEYTKKDGTVFPVSIRGWIIKGKEHKQSGAWYIIRDITEHKKMKEALLQSEKLKSIGTITSGVAHEFNNILTIISGNVELLEGTYKDHEKLTDSLRTIRRAVKDGSEISGKMLKFTKTEKDTTGFTPYDIKDLIKETMDFTMPRWKNMAQAKGINYHIDTEYMMMVPSILCNPTEIREVFINIINNALDAMHDGGTITVATRCVRSEELGVDPPARPAPPFGRVPIRAGSKKENASPPTKRQADDLNGDFVEITFADTGEGMSEDVKKNIFDPFFTTKMAKGTGLGMSTAYGIITRHGGKIEVDSEEGKGATFTLQFPVAIKAVSPEESPEPEQEIKGKGLRILVVDDEKDICILLDRLLSEEGHKVKTVDNGAEAIELTKREEFDLVLCDMVMQEIHGYDVIKILNGLDKRPKVGIITGWGEKLKPQEDENLKANFIIKKPFDFSELTRHINGLFI